MNLEEQQLKRRVEERQLALTEKVNSLKERVEQIKRMTDVRSAAKERPAIMLAGSVLVGFIAKKLASSRSRVACACRRSVVLGQDRRTALGANCCSNDGGSNPNCHRSCQRYAA